MQPQGHHIPNLVVAEVENDSHAYHFTGDACVVEFLEWLEELTEEDTRQVNVIAHNFQGYDGYFVVEGYHSTSQMVEQLRNGCKLLEVKHDRVRFIDSLSFFAMPLSAFPKIFGLTELKKGYFPHLFNLPEHQDYVGPVPSMDYYIPESMSPEGRKAFETWHADQRKNNVEFHFAEELVQYCESDVHLLKEGCMTFKTLFKEQTGFNPFEHVRNYVDESCQSTWQYEYGENFCGLCRERFFLRKSISFNIWYGPQRQIRQRFSRI